MTSQDVSPLAQNMAMVQPAFSALVVPSRHIHLLLVFGGFFLFFFLFSGGFHAPQPMPTNCLCPFFLGIHGMWGVKMSCLGRVQDGQRWRDDFETSLSYQNPNVLGLWVYSFKKKTKFKTVFLSRLQGNMEASAFKG